MMCYICTDHLQHGHKQVTMKTVISKVCFQCRTLQASHHWTPLQTEGHEKHRVCSVLAAIHRWLRIDTSQVATDSHFSGGCQVS
jgi:hypothetical protein